MDFFGVFFGVTVGSGFSWEMSQKLCFFCRLPWIWEETNRRNVSKGISARLCFLSLQEAFLGLSGLRWATPAPYSSTRLKCICPHWKSICLHQHAIHQLKCICPNWQMYLSAPSPYCAYLSTFIKFRTSVISRIASLFIYPQLHRLVTYFYCIFIDYSDTLIDMYGDIWN